MIESRAGRIMSHRNVYLDNNATTPLDPRVLARMNECWVDAFANPGSGHEFGRAARMVLEDSRESIASSLDADPSELIFTSGGTESINTVIQGLTLGGRPGCIAVTAGEHPATSEAVTRAQQRGFSRVVIPVDEHGQISDRELANLPWSELKLVCLILAHNETGVIQDARLLSELCQRYRVPLLLDAVQAVGKIPVSFRSLGCSALAFGAHKFHGPRGVGGLLLRKGLKIPPLLEGGHQESGRRAGTEPVPLIAGMAKALEIWQKEAVGRTTAVEKLRDDLQASLEHNCGPVQVHGQLSQRLPNTLSIAFPGISGEALLMNLHLAGVACSLGSTCASGSAEPAPALLAMGVDPDVCKSTVRFSLSCQNTAEDIEYASETITKIVRRMRSESGE